MSTQLSDDASTKFLPKIFTNDPVLFKSYVNKKVTICTDDGKIHVGVVYTVDPVSESIVLVQPNQEVGQRQLKIIMRSAIKTIDCCFDTEIPISEMFCPPVNKFSKEEILKRKNLVLQLLLENKFPVEDDDGVLCIEKNVVRIEPPYEPENCLCLNSVVLNRIQTILTRKYD